MIAEEKKEWAAALLRQRAEALGRLPKKEDFDEGTRSRIKAFLGPWPRVLEAAGLKEIRPKAANAKKRKKTASKKPQETPSHTKGAHE